MARIDVTLQVAATVAAIASALLWGWAARLSVPPVTGDNYGGRGPFADMMKRQAALNGRAAAAAAVAAAFQSMALLAQGLGW